MPLRGLCQSLRSLEPVAKTTASGPGVGPEHALLHDIGRAEYRSITDDQAMEAFSLLSKSEGIIPAIETAHALAGALQVGKELGPNSIILINLSGRGDKDVQTAAKYFGIPLE